MAELIPSRGKYIEITEKTAADVPPAMTAPDTGTVIPLSRLLYYNPDSEEPEIITLGQGHSMLSKGQWDAVIDDAYTIHFSDTWPTIAEAIAAGAVSIFVRSAGDTAAITIASASAVQRIQGKDADTTELPVSVTCNKDGVRFEQLLINSLLAIGANVDEYWLENLLVNGAGTITISGNTTGHIEAVRCSTANTTPITCGIVESLLLTRCFFTGVTTGNYIAFSSGGTNGVQIIGNTFRSSGATGYQIETTGAGHLTRPVIANNTFEHGDNGCTNLSLFQGVIIGNTMRAFESPFASGVRQLRITSPAGSNISTRVIGNYFESLGVADVLFECASADADADGLILLANTFRTGTILGSQNAMWIGNDMAGCLINFQSKTGLVVLGGDMTGATLQGIPTDIVFRNVKGQADRGHYLPPGNTGDLAASGGT